MSVAFAGLSIIILAFLAHFLFWYNRVPNRGLSALLLVWSGQLYWYQPSDWYWDIATGACAFAAGVCFWWLGKISASESKLLLVIGLILGWQAGLAALILLPFAILFLRLYLPLNQQVQQGHHPLWRRLRILNARQKLPNGLAIIFTAMLASLVKIFL